MPSAVACGRANRDVRVAPQGVCHSPPDRLVTTKKRDTAKRSGTFIKSGLLHRYCPNLNEVATRFLHRNLEISMSLPRRGRDSLRRQRVSHLLCKKTETLQFWQQWRRACKLEPASFSFSLFWKGNVPPLALFNNSSAPGAVPLQRNTNRYRNHCFARNPSYVV